MARVGGPSRWSRSSRSRDRARRHVAAAGRFADEVGGLDREVKAFFLGLPAPAVGPILDAYERHYGSAARRYAAAAIPRWRSGKTKVSGQTADRLFALVPPFMPPAVRHRLVESLWTQHLPATSTRIEVGEGELPEECERVRSDVRVSMAAYRLPARLRDRFEWLAAGDAACVQALLAEVVEREADHAVAAAAAEMDRIRDHAAGRPVNVTYERTIVAGRHTIRLCWMYRTPDQPWARWSRRSLAVPTFLRPTRALLARVGWCLAAAVLVVSIGWAWLLTLTTMSASSTTLHP